MMLKVRTGGQVRTERAARCCGRLTGGALAAVPRAGRLLRLLDFVPYEATKHHGCHALYAAGVSARTIGKLAGWSEGAVEELLKVYGHGDLAAQAEIDALYETGGNEPTTERSARRSMPRPARPASPPSRRSPAPW
jgi:hypothetical protein